MNPYIMVFVIFSPMIACVVGVLLNEIFEE